MRYGAPARAIVTRTQTVTRTTVLAICCLIAHNRRWTLANESIGISNCRLPLFCRFYRRPPLPVVQPIDMDTGSRVNRISERSASGGSRSPDAERKRAPVLFGEQNGSVNWLQAPATKHLNLISCFRRARARVDWTHFRWNSSNQSNWCSDGDWKTWRANRRKMRRRRDHQVWS